MQGISQRRPLRIRSRSGDEPDTLPHQSWGKQRRRHGTVATHPVAGRLTPWSVKMELWRWRVLEEVNEGGRDEIGQRCQR